MIATYKTALLGLWERAVSQLSASLLDDAPPAAKFRAQREIVPLTVKESRSMAERDMLRSLLPYESWDPETGLYYNRDTIGFVVSGPPATNLTDTNLGSLRAIFTTNHAPGTTIQISVIADPNTEPLLERWETAGGTHISELSDLFSYMSATRVRYLRDAKWRSIFSDQAFLLRSYHLVISYAAPVSRLILDGAASPDMLCAEVQRARDAIIGTLRSANMHLRPLAPTGLINLLHGLLNPSTERKAHIQHDPLNPINSQMVDHDTVLLLGSGASSLVHEDVSYSLLTFNVKQFPQIWHGSRNGDLIGSFSSDILRIPCPFWLTMTVRVPDALASRTKVTNKRTRATQMATSPLSKYVTQWRERQRDWDHVAHRMDSGDNLLQACFSVTLLTPDGHERAAEHALHSSYNALGWTLSKIRYAPTQALLASLPMGISQDTNRALDRFGLYRTMTGSSCANIAPWIAEWTGTATPTLLLTGRRGQVTYFDPFDNKEGNYNVYCCATSGVGKSFATQERIVATLRAGGLVYVIDAGHSYRNICELLGGTYIDFGDKTSQIKFNPFSSFRGDDREFMDEQMPLLKLLLAEMASPNKALKQKQLSILERAIAQAWRDRRNNATVGTVVDALRADDSERGRSYDAPADLATMLYSYTPDGMYGSYFDGASNIDLDNHFVVLDLDGLNLKSDLLAVVLQMLMMRITQAMYLQGSKSRRKLCIIDEAWRLMAGGSTGEFIEAGYRVARKHGGSFMAISQSLSDWNKSQITRTVRSCSDTGMYLRLKPDDITEEEASGRLTSAKASILRGLHTAQGQYSEIALDTPKGMSVVRLVVDPFTEKTYSTNPNEIEFIRTARSRGTPLLQAIQMLVQQSAGR